MTSSLYAVFIPFCVFIFAVFLLLLLLIIIYLFANSLLCDLQQRVSLLNNLVSNFFGEQNPKKSKSETVYTLAH